MNTNQIATIIKRDLEEHNVKVLNNICGDLRADIVHYINNITGYEDNFFYYYGVKNYADEILEKKDFIFNLLDELMNRQEQESYLKDMYSMQDITMNFETKTYMLIDSFSCYYLQKALKTHIYNEEIAIRCILFQISCYTKEDLNALKEMAIKENERIERDEELFGHSDLNAYAVWLEMPYRDIDLRDLEDWIGGSAFPMPLHMHLIDSMNVVEYHFEFTAPEDEDTVRGILNEYFKDATSINLKTLHKDVFITRQMFENLVTAAYQRVRGFKEMNIDYNGVNEETVNILKDSIDLVAEMFQIKNLEIEPEEPVMNDDVEPTGEIKNLIIEDMDEPEEEMKEKLPEPEDLYKGTEEPEEPKEIKKSDSNLPEPEDLFKDTEINKLFDESKEEDNDALLNEFFNTDTDFVKKDENEVQTDDDEDNIDLKLGLYKYYTLIITMNKDVSVYELYNVLNDAPTLYVTSNKMYKKKKNNVYIFTLEFQAYESTDTIKGIVRKELVETYPDAEITVEIEDKE